AGMRQAVRRSSAPVIGVSPIIGGGAVRGVADQGLATINVESAGSAVGMTDGARSAGGVLDGWLVDTTDAEAIPNLEAAGIRAKAIPLWMTDIDTTAVIAQNALDLAWRHGVHP